jgi:hypothetical protein
MNQEAEGGCGYYLLNIYHLTYNADLEDKHTGWPKKKIDLPVGESNPGLYKSVSIFMYKKKYNLTSRACFSLAE